MTAAPSRPVTRDHGGKWRLAPWVIQHLPPHVTYGEPFRTPALRAEISVPRTDVPRPVINAQVLDNIKIQPEQQISAVISLSVVDPEEGES